jgi:1-acyl-sn-glycerol-3-phosphate acyltransferase
MSASKARWTTLLFNTIPIERHRINRKSAAQAVDLVREGWSIVIYPEGGRTPTGQLREFKGGAAFMAEKTHAPIVPVYIDGIGYWRSEQAKAPRYTSLPTRRRSPVSVTFGAPLVATDDTTVRRLNAQLEAAVVDLARRVTGDSTIDIERA